jgi:hypothetical protein
VQDDAADDDDEDQRPEHGLGRHGPAFGENVKRSLEGEHHAHLGLGCSPIVTCAARMQNFQREELPMSQIELAVSYPLSAMCEFALARLRVTASCLPPDAPLLM